MNTSKSNKKQFRVLASISLCVLYFLLASCSGKTDFERNINFNKAWKIDNEEKAGNVFSLNKTFEADLINDKQYLLELQSAGTVHELKLNNKIITGTIAKPQTISYNITNNLKNINSIELKIDNAEDLVAKLHCVNKLFITEISSNLETENNTQIEIGIKNIFNSEKQGVLKFALYSASNKKLESKETPFFIAGNAENKYRQTLQLKHTKEKLDGAKLIGELYYKDKLFDSVQHTIKDNANQKMASKN